MAVSGPSSLSQSITQQLQLMQAQRNAESARQRARSLQAQASDAQRTADRAQENARTLKSDAALAQDASARADQSLQATKSWMQTKSQLGSIYTRIAAAQKEASAQGVTNAQGQVLGTVVDVTA